MKCFYCGETVGREYRVNCVGDYYCNDGCYEGDLAKRAVPGESDHPYGDIYALIRMDYLKWVDLWEDELETYDGEYIDKANELIEMMNSFIYDHMTFYADEGGDGIFAREIYKYLLGFEKIIEEIKAWRPRRKK